MTSGNPKLKKVVVNGVDVSEYVISFEVTREYKKVIGEAEIVFSKKINNVLTISKTEGVAWPVTIQRGVSSPTEEYIFRGEVMSIQDTIPTYTFNCVDKYYSAVRHEVTTSYDIDIDPQNGVLSEIFMDLINTHTDLTCDSTTVQNSGTALTLKKFICNHADVFERCDAIADGLNWQHYYDPDTDKIYLEPRGFVTESDVLEVGVNVIEAPDWEYSKDRLINELTLRGAEQAVETTVFQDGDNTEGQTVSLSKKPVSMKVFVGSGSFDPTGTGTKPSDNNANLKSGGKINSTSGSYDYEYDDDPNVKKVYFYDSSRGSEPSFTPPTGTNNIEIQYTYNIPSPVIKSNPASIAKYEIHKTTHVRTDIKNVSDAEVYVDKTLEYFSEPFISTTLKVSNVNKLKVGHKYRCIDAKKDIDEYLIATKIKMMYPYAFDEITVGDEILKETEWEIQTMDRIKRLEELEGESQDLLLHVIAIDHSMIYERRYTKLELKNIAGETGIYGHSTFGVYGTAKYGASTSGGFVLGHTTFGILGTSKIGSGATTPVTVRIIQGDNTYKEFLYDDDFYDSSNSTATWDTTNHEITFTANQIIQTSEISLGIKYNYYTVNLAQVTGDVKVEISGDGGKNWEEVTLNSRTLFTNSDTTGVLLKITETAGSNAKIENTYDKEAYDEPAIKVKLE